MDASANQMFEEFSSEIYNSALHATQHEVGVGEENTLDQSNILDVANMSNEEYRLVFPYYTEDRNEVIVNCDKQFQQFNSELYTVHMPETDPKNTDSELIFIQEETNGSLTEDIENLNPTTDLFSSDNVHNIQENTTEDNTSTYQYFAEPQIQYITPASNITKIPEGASVTADADDSSLSHNTSVTKDTFVAGNSEVSVKICSEYEQQEEDDVDDPDYLDDPRKIHQDTEDLNSSCDFSRKLRAVKAKVLNMYLPVTEKNIFALHGIDISLPVTCDICNIDFGDLQLFDDHMKSHVDNRHFMCQFCTKSYVSWENLVAHRKVVHQGQFISCNDCSCRKDHKNLCPLRFPVGKFPSGCEECIAGFVSSAQLNKHYRSHAEEVSEKDKPKKVKMKKKTLTSQSANWEDQVEDNKEDDPLTSSLLSQEEKPVVMNFSKPYNVLSLASSNEKEELPHCIQLNSELRYKCPLCSSIFKDLIMYKVHKVTHENKIQFLCQICSETFTDKESFDDHQSGHDIVEEYYCFNCQMDFNTPRDMQRHIERVHYQRPEVKLTCNVCSLNYAVNKFMNHYLICFRNRKSKGLGKQESFTCHICKEIYVNSIDLQEHLKTHSSSDEQSYLCEFCGSIFNNQSIFTKHMRCHSFGGKDNDTQDRISEIDLLGNTNDSVSDYVCEYCGREFKKKTNLQLHVRRHTGEKPYQCTFCNKAFYTGAQLSVHTRQHTGERPYVCKICNKTFASPTVLYTHKKGHANGAQHICSLCGKKFLWRSAYQNHMRIHSNVRPYKCDICSKAFSFKNRLTAHLRRHQEGKLENFDFVLNKKICVPLCFQCSDCGQSFATNKELENHHEEKCYLTMITFFPPSNADNSTNKNTSLLFLDSNNVPNPLCDEQQVVL